MTALKFGEYLVREGVLSRDGLRRALEAQKSLECRLGTVVLDLGLVPERTLLRSLGRFSSARTVSGHELTAVPRSVVEMVPAKFALRHQVIPFRLSGKTLSVAVIDPKDLLMEDELSLMTGFMIASFVALEVRIEEALARYHGRELSVQMVSLLKRLRSDEHGKQAADAEGDGAPSAPPPPEEGSRGEASARVGRPAARRSGAVPSREPDDTAVVVLSEDELADFPSLRKSLEDTDVGVGGGASAGVKTAEVATDENGAAVAERAKDVSADTAPASEPEVSTQPVPSDSAEERLEFAARALLEAEMREEIADAVFAFCTPYLRRRLLLAVREGIIMGWRGEGEGIDPLWVRSISIPVEEPTVFNQLAHGGELWLGPLPRMAGHQDLLLGLGGQEAAACLVLPIQVRSRVIAYLYGDNLEGDLEALPVATLRRLAAKTGLALEVTMLRNKIVTL